MPITRASFPNSALIGRFPTATIPTSYPEIRGPYSVPDWAVPAIEEIYRSPVLKSRYVEVYLLEDVYLAHESLIFNNMGHLYTWSSKQNSDEEITQAHRSIQDALYYRTIERCEDRLVMCKRRSPFVFGHWMIDMLPMAYVAARLLRVQQRQRFLLHRTTENMDNIMTDSLSHLGISADSIYWSDNRPLFCKELVVVSGITEHGEYLTSIVRDCHDVIADGCRGAGYERLFVLRRWYNRNIVNETELAQLAQERGFKIFNPAEADLATQISVFRDARVIVGAMGSSLTNTIYSRPGSRLIVLSPESMPDVFLWMLCQLRGIKYFDIRCEHVGSNSEPPEAIWTRDFYLDPDRFRDLLVEIGEIDF